MSDYDGVPTFQHGQVISASAHLNALADGVQTLYEHQLGSYTGFAGGLLRESADLSGIYQWHGFLRCKHRYFYYHYYAGPGTVEIVITDPDGDIVLHTNTIAGGTPDAHYAGYIDISAYVTVDDFYELNCSGPADTILYFLGEVDADETFPEVVPAVPVGADHWGVGGVPTADRWNALSYYVELTANRVIHPRPPAVPSGRVSSCAAVYAGEWVHHARYLTFKINLNDPQENDIFGNPHCEHLTFKIAINEGGTWTWYDVLKIGCGDCGGITLDRQPVCGDYEATVDNGLALDLETIHMSGHYLTKGERYLLQIDATETKDAGDGDGSASVDWIFEEPGDVPAMQYWVYITPWTAITDYVNGNFGSPQVQTIIDDAAVVKDAAYLTNVPMRTREETESMLGNDNAAHMIRRHRYLHILSNDLDLRPALLFYRDERYTEDVAADESTDGFAHSKGDAKETEVSIQNETDPFGNLRFHTIDLTTIPGLWPGTRYRLRDVHSATEDTEG